MLIFATHSFSRAINLHLLQNVEDLIAPGFSAIIAKREVPGCKLETCFLKVIHFLMTIEPNRSNTRAFHLLAVDK